MPPIGTKGSFRASKIRFHDSHGENLIEFIESSHKLATINDKTEILEENLGLSQLHDDQKLEPRPISQSKFSKVNPINATTTVFDIKETTPNMNSSKLQTPTLEDIIDPPSAEKTPKQTPSKDRTSDNGSSLLPENQKDKTELLKNNLGMSQLDDNEKLEPRPISPRRFSKVNPINATTTVFDIKEAIPNMNSSKLQAPTLEDIIDPQSAEKTPKQIPSKEPTSDNGSPLLPENHKDKTELLKNNLGISEHNDNSELDDNEKLEPRPISPRRFSKVNPINATTTVFDIQETTPNINSSKLQTPSVQDIIIDPLSGEKTPQQKPSKGLTLDEMPPLMPENQKVSNHSKRKSQVQAQKLQVQSRTSQSSDARQKLNKMKKDIPQDSPMVNPTNPS